MEALTVLVGLLRIGLRLVWALAARVQPGWVPNGSAILDEERRVEV